MTWQTLFEACMYIRPRGICSVAHWWSITVSLGPPACQMGKCCSPTSHSLTCHDSIRWADEQVMWGIIYVALFQLHAQCLMCLVIANKGRMIRQVLKSELKCKSYRSPKRRVSSFFNHRISYRLPTPASAEASRMLPPAEFPFLALFGSGNDWSHQLCRSHIRGPICNFTRKIFSYY